MLSEAIQQNPDHAGLLNARCWTRAITGIEFEEALADCERAVAADPQNASILDSRAFVNLQLGRVEEAIADADAALAISPTLPASLYVRGIARLRHGEREAGEEDLAAARMAVFDIDLVYRDYGLTP